MGVFGKEDEYMDYTLLKKKGILKLKKEETLKNTKMEGGFIDFTAMRNEPQTSSTNSTTATNNFGFLADMASASSSNPSLLANFDSAMSSNPTSNLSENMDGREFNALKIKVDDIDYKIDRFIERLDRLEEKLSKIGY